MRRNGTLAVPVIAFLILIAIPFFSNVSGLEAPYDWIVSPEEGDTVSGTVNVTAKVISCNCSTPTALYIDGAFVMNGTFIDMVLEGGRWYQIYVHLWDSTTVENGTHQLEVKGKHREYSDTINITVENGEKDDDDDDLGFGLLWMIPIVSVVVIAFGRKRLRT